MSMTVKEIKEELKKLNRVLLEDSRGNYRMYCTYGPGWLDYEGAVQIKNGKTLFGGIAYKTCQELIDAVSEYNKTLPMPAFMYDEGTTMSSKIVRAFREYVKNLGMKTSYGGHMLDAAYEDAEIGDMFGNAFIKIKLRYHSEVDESNSFKGSITRIISQYSVAETEFSNYDEMIGAINSMLSCEALINCSKAIGVLNSMNASRNDSAKKIDTDLRMNVTVTEMKQTVIAKLKEALKTLEGNESRDD